MEEDTVLNTARLGIEAESFLASSLGKYLKGKADELIADQTAKLIQCSPSDIEQNTEYRNGIQIGALFITWLEDAIADGKNAQVYIQQIEDESLS